MQIATPNASNWLNLQMKFEGEVKERAARAVRTAAAEPATNSQRIEWPVAAKQATRQEGPNLNGYQMRLYGHLPSTDRTSFRPKCTLYFSFLSILRQRLCRLLRWSLEVLLRLRAGLPSRRRGTSKTI